MNTALQASSWSRRVAYPGLLATTALGTMSSNIINAPLWVIRTQLGMTAQEAVLAVSVFTVAMATCVPLAGWLGDRVGIKPFLIGALSIMVLAEVVAAAAGGLEMLVIARALQGVACSAIPPCVQSALITIWPENTGRTMGAWASAIGAGQAVGPPFGGMITDAFGWRWVFLGHAALVLLLMLLLATVMPGIARRRPPMHLLAMAWLIVGGGSAATAVLVAGQRGPSTWLVPLALSAVAGATLFLCLSLRRAQRVALDPLAPAPLLAPGLLRDPGYLAAAAGAGLAMGSMAVAIVAMPLFLASELALGPAQIGLTVLTLAVAMMASGPVAARTGRARGSAVQLVRGVIVLILAALVVTVAMLSARLGVSPWVILVLVVLGLLLTGAGIAFAQSAAATELALSPAGKSGAAVGIHNMARFLAMAFGYSAVSLAYATGVSLLIFPGVALSAVGLLAALYATRRKVPAPSPHP